MTQDILILNADDTVGIALVDIRSGAALSSFETLAQSDIPKGHKVALRPIAKGAAVISYGQIIGYATEDIAAGANIITFTTGRGSVSGYMPTPCIKLSTNDDLYARMGDDMDINCGDIISGGISLADKGQDIYREILRVASGGTTKSEELGFGGVEFVPWQVGAVM